MVENKAKIESEDTVFDEPRFTRYVPWSCCPLVRDCLLNVLPLE